MWDLGSPSRDQTHVPGIARQILNHWTTREVPSYDLFYLCVSDQRCLYEALESFKCSKSPKKTYFCTTCPAFPCTNTCLHPPAFSHKPSVFSKNWRLAHLPIINSVNRYLLDLFPGWRRQRGISGGKTIRNINFVLVRYKRVCFLSFSFVSFAFLVPSATEFTNDTLIRLSSATEVQTYTYTHTSTHIYTHHRNLAGVLTACWPFEIHHPRLGGPAKAHLNRDLCSTGHIQAAHLFLPSSLIRRQGAVLPHHIRPCIFIKEENQDFPGGPADGGPPANAGDTSSTSGPGRFPTRGANKLECSNYRAHTPDSRAMTPKPACCNRNLRSATGEDRTPQWEKPVHRNEE